MINDWDNFFVGELGAAAALAGLLFVSVSVNHTRILQLGRMADRGLEALIMLLLVVVITSLGLVPNQSPRLLGLEILLAAALTCRGVFALQRKYMTEIKPPYRRRSTVLAISNQAAVITLAVSGLVTLCRGEAGFYLLPPGILATFISAFANAWVLLIEILR